MINYGRIVRETGHRPLDLDYRTHPTTDVTDRTFTTGLISYASIAIALYLLIAFLTRQAVLSAVFFSIVATAALILAIMLAVKGRARLALAAFPGILVAWPILAILVVTLGDHVGGTLLVVSVLAAFFADSVASHYVHWLLANHRLDPQARNHWKRVWATRLLLYRVPSAPERLFYLLYLLSLLAFPIVTALALAAFTLGTHRQPALEMSPLFAALSVIAVLLFTAIQRRGTPRSVADALTLVVRTLVVWCTYGRRALPAPGIFRSPNGRLFNRQLLTVVVQFALAYLLLPLFLFFPTGIFSDPPRWSALYHRVHEWGALTRWSEKLTDFKPAEFQYPAGPARQHGESDEAYDQRATAGLSAARADWELREFQRYLNHHRATWLPLIIDAFFTWDPYYQWAFVISLANCFLVPILAFFFVIAAPLLVLLRFLEPAIGERSPAIRDPERVSDWACYLERLRGSSNGLERDHLWIGAHAQDDYPILLHHEILSEHAYLVGDSGSGKTAIGVTSFARQLIARRDCPVIIIDLKGDKDLFDSVHDAVEQADPDLSRFRYFTVRVGCDTHTFNPFEQGTERLSLNQVCETLLEALHLNHGEGYGRSYYSRVARSVLTSTLREHPDAATFTELYRLIKARPDLEEKQRRDAFELIAVLESLASFEQLNITAKNRSYPAPILEHAIHMPTVLAQNQVVYFWLPSILEPASVREIAKLALYSLIIAALHFRDEHGRPKQAYLFVDEFQRIASTNFKIVLEQARAFGIGAILANQTAADLKTPDCDLRPTVQTNTRLKMCFSATDPEQQDLLMQGSGEALDYTVTVSMGQQGQNFAIAEYIRPRLMRNDILRLSDDPSQCLFHVHRGSGYSQYTGFPVPVKCGFTITERQRDDLRKKTWPVGQPGTIRVQRAPLTVQAEPTLRIQAGEKALAEAQAKDPQATIDFNDEIPILLEFHRQRVARSEFIPTVPPPD